MTNVRHMTFLETGDLPGIPFKTGETYCSGRDGNDNLLNEDRVLVNLTRHGRVLAAIDGITPRTGWKMPYPGDCNGMVTTGWMGAYVVENHLRERLVPGVTMAALMAGIHAEWQEHLRASEAPPEEIMGAVFEVYVPWESEHGQIWRFGDPIWAYETATGWVSSLDGIPVSNSSDADNRVAAIEAEMTRLGIAPEALLGLEPTLLGYLAKEGRAAMDHKRLAAGGEAWLSSLEKTMMLVHQPVDLPGDVLSLNLATDGVLSIPYSLEDSLIKLADLREQDCLMLGHNPDNRRTAKGFVGADGTIYPFTDDVGMISVMI